MLRKQVPLAQWKEHRSSKPGVTGSSPVGNTRTSWGIAQLVERTPYKRQVLGSIPSTPTRDYRRN